MELYQRMEEGSLMGRSHRVQLSYKLKVKPTLSRLPQLLRVRNPPAMQETQVQSLGQEDSLKEEMGTHSDICASKIPWTKEPGKLESMG